MNFTLYRSCCAPIVWICRFEKNFWSRLLLSLVHFLISLLRCWKRILRLFVIHPICIYIYIHSISIDQKWKFSSKLFKLDRKLVSRSSCHQSFARTHVRRSHNLWIALRNFHLSKQLSLRYSFESRMFASPVFIILARLADVIKRERLNIETFTNR